MLVDGLDKIIKVAAGYALYGSATMIVLSLGGGPVNGFLLDPVNQ